jgi:drug/metabolite transporter (DMT)-like permease
LTLSALLRRFAAAYLVLLIVVGVGLNLAGAKSSMGGNMAALLGAVMWVCMDFAKKNGRYFTREEKPRVVVGMLVIDLVMQMAVSVAIGLFAGASALSLGPRVLILLFVGVLHAAVIWFFVGFAGKQYAAAEARRNKNG